MLEVKALKVSVVSNVLKVLLILFSIGVICFGAFVLPIIAEEMGEMYPEIAYAKLPILLICELLLVLLLVGIGIIMYFLIQFDRNLLLSSGFVRGLEILAGMCMAASVGVIGLFLYMNTFGGPGPFLTLIMIGIILIIWILAAVIILLRTMVKKAIISDGNPNFDNGVIR